MASLAEEIGMRIRRFRRARGWTLVQLAIAMGSRTRQGHLVNLERGHYVPRVQTLLDVANALGVLLADLLPPQLTASAFVTWDGLTAAGMSEEAAAAMILWLRALDRGEAEAPGGALP